MNKNQTISIKIDSIYSPYYAVCKYNPDKKDRGSCAPFFIYGTITMSMKLLIKRIDKSLPIPSYQTKGAVAFDLYARIDTIIKPWTPTIVPTNIIVKVPEGYFLMLASRSSTPLKKHVIVANGIGVIDEDYHGDKDEIGVQLLNFSQEDVRIKKGDRIAQALLVSIAKVQDFEEVDSISCKSRGGFGSTKGHS